MFKQLGSFWISALLLVSVAELTPGVNMLSAQTKTVLDGVYTAVQAQRGEETYYAKCSKCHDDSAADVISIRAGQFIDRWREQPLTPVFEFMTTKMPKDAPGELDQKAYLDILSFILHENGYPEGATELTAAAIPDIQLISPDGPKPLPAGALVIAVGCLAPAAGNWTLTNVGSLVRTRVSDETTPEEIKASQARSLGAQTLQIRNLELIDKFDAKANAGHKVQIKGSYTASSSRVSAGSAESLAATCP